MPIIIREVVSEVVLEPGAPGQTDGAGTGASGDMDMEHVVRRATERVLEVLRREWDR